eukprot:gnl/TRDRNA2_/TRDRNA2_162229_c0_seq1.p2 gnl/TRDRNA2_/TRDRNA2_162229_c0~~gnl/TRDRNA2_/TRDRNA2_162229_c0_seq1.p2  ORF type:complete len:189 (+),score=28.73 gnl/TRDRNA2_/TRDRNA2_162229_c0_seq1:550-1116(+)
MQQTAQGKKTTIFSSAADAYATSGDLPRRGALLFGLIRDIEPGLSPNHISFLWSRTNERMFELLAPFLPLTRLLDLYVLDFDVEMRDRLAGTTADKVVPAIQRFFGGFAAEAPQRRLTASSSEELQGLAQLPPFHSSSAREFARSDLTAVTKPVAALILLCTGTGVIFATRATLFSAADVAREKLLGS